ncbi:NAD(P)/FAD-dependent oxidoreductase [Microvenator marinus]|uniref:NAD(P)/FAD-dependent oxidoreductase n=1 Tax=Microvenator marinus TaxID=2600177 RepID=A0A5B8XK85_9DELT|nr:NAD(P)/FAD-dependent oxidoreductase [Microvenator marinus]QED26212.1 NAD(P)/FAD-dependent oxidoreductase [Microvenator marinus]
MKVGVIGGGPAAVSAILWLEKFGVEVFWLNETKLVGGMVRKTFNQVLDLPIQPHEDPRKITSELEVLSRKLSTRMNVGCLEEICSSDGPVTLQYTQDGTTSAQEVAGVIIATGTSKRLLDVPGEAELLDSRVFQSASAHKDSYSGRKVAVIGAGDAAFEGACLLAEGGARVIVFVRADISARGEFVKRAAELGVEVRNGTQVSGFKENSTLEIQVESTQGAQTVEVDAAFVRIGVSPNLPIFTGQSPKVDREGYLWVDANMNTSVPGIWAAGDVRSTILRSISTALGDGALAAASAYASMTSRT